MTGDDRPHRFERRAMSSTDDLAAAIAAAHTIIETTNEDGTREMAKSIVTALQRLQAAKGESDV